MHEGDASVHGTFGYPLAADEEVLASVIYEAVCASTDPGVSLWYRSLDRPEFLTAARAVLDHLRINKEGGNV